MERLQSPVAEVGGDGRVRHANESLVLLLGRDLPGADWVTAVLGIRDPAEASVLWKGWLEGGKPLDGDYPLESAQGTHRLLRWRHEIVRDPEGVLQCVVCSGQDVTGEAAAADAEAARARAVASAEAAERARRSAGALLEAMPCAWIRFDSEGRAAACNAAFERLSGKGIAECAGGTVAEVFPGAVFLEPVTAGRAPRAAGRLPGDAGWAEVSRVDLDGGEMALLLESRPEPMPASQDGAMAGPGVSPQAAGGDPFEWVAAAPTPAFLVTRAGAIRKANPAAVEMFGFDPEGGASHLAGLLGCIHGRAPSVECGGAEACRECAVGDAVRGIVGGQLVPQRREVRLQVERDGQVTERPLVVTAAPVGRDGEDLSVVWIEDVAVARGAEEKMREQSLLLATSHDAACVVDLDGRIRFWNKGAEQLYGWEPEAAIGGEAADRMFGGSRPMWDNLRRLVLEEGYWDGELLQVHRNSQQLTVEARASLLRDTRGKARSVLMVTTDLTERRQMERQLMRAQRLESLGTLACGIAHDLNNVLTPVQMAADLLRPTVAGSDGERFLDLLHRSARRGGEIIQQLLLFGRGVESSRAETDLRFLLKETVKILRETFPKGIQVRLDLPPDLWTVVGDVTQLHQVLLNLCVNARDAMPKGGTLALSAENVTLSDVVAAGEGPDVKAGRYVVVQVSDTGTGIPPEVVDRIFDPFFTTKPLGQGTGLGLSTARGIARSHGGFIRVLSTPGAGSKFRLHLPVGARAVEPEPVPEVIPDTPVGEKCILVVDDEDLIRELLRSALERAGYRVLTAVDGAEAISVFGRRQSEIAAVVIDMMMPFIDGAAAIAAFRRIKPSVFVLAISGLPNQRDEAERAGGDRVSFLLKPFVARDLLAALAHGLQEERPRRPEEPAGR